MLTVGAWRVDQGIITAGTLVTFAYLFRLVAGPMRVFSWLLGQLPIVHQQARPAADHQPQGHERQ